MKRRDLVVFGAGLLTGGAVWRWWQHGIRLRPPVARLAPAGTTLDRYGHGAMPPEGMGPLALDRATLPPPPAGNRSVVTRTLTVEAVEQRLPVSVDQMLDAWTFDGSVPGPIIRATEGDTLEITLKNRTTRAHNLHFHGRHEIAADGWEPVAPGGQATYRLTAGPFGLHPYHCDMTPTEDHIVNGLYGAMIVDPPRPRPKAREVVLVLCGFDLDGDGKAELFGWNGVAGFFAKYPIKVTAGELVRVYLVNLATTEPSMSFHLHAETFDVYPTGTSLVPSERTDVVTLGPTERAMLEFRLPERGRYMFHPHQTKLAERGAMGWFSAV